MCDLLLSGWQWTLGSWSIGIVSVAWRSAKAIWLLIHGETGGGRGASSWSVDDTSRRGGLEIGGRGCLSLRVSVTVGVAVAGTVSVGLSL